MVARGWMYSLRALSSPLETTLTIGRDRLQEGAGEIGRAVMRHLEDLRLQTEVSLIVLTRQEAAGLVVQVAGEQDS